VPPVLLSGHHANVAKWRWKQSVLRTKRCRPDMYQALRFETKQEKKLMKELRAEYPEDFGK
jgi:tRNA (guanine37-N1)-methyltransferase